jgi:hypothetical protein
MNDDYDFSDDFNKAGDVPPSPADSGGGRPMLKDLPKSDKNNLRDMLSVPVGGGTLTPAKIGNTYGAKWTKNFAEGGKVKDKSAPQVSSASKRADGIAQRGKTKGRYL